MSSVPLQTGAKRLLVGHRYSACTAHSMRIGLFLLAGCNCIVVTHRPHFRGDHERYEAARGIYPLFRNQYDLEDV